LNSLDCRVGGASSQRRSEPVIAKPVGLRQSSQFTSSLPPRKDAEAGLPRRRCLLAKTFRACRLGLLVMTDRDAEHQ